MIAEINSIDAFGSNIEEICQKVEGKKRQNSTNQPTKQRENRRGKGGKIKT